MEVIFDLSEKNAKSPCVGGIHDKFRVQNLVILLDKLKEKGIWMAEKLKRMKMENLATMDPEGNKIEL